MGIFPRSNNKDLIVSGSAFFGSLYQRCCSTPLFLSLFAPNLSEKYSLRMRCIESSSSWYCSSLALMCEPFRLFFTVNNSVSIASKSRTLSNPVSEASAKISKNASKASAFNKSAPMSCSISCFFCNANFLI